jgi:hypothetical protein
MLLSGRQTNPSLKAQWRGYFVSKETPSGSAVDASDKLGANPAKCQGVIAHAPGFD